MSKPRIKAGGKNYPGPEDVQSYCKWFLINHQIYGLSWRPEVDHDVLSAAICGVYRSLKTWDPEKGNWTTYANLAIVHAVCNQREFEAGGRSAAELHVKSPISYDQVRMHWDDDDYDRHAKLEPVDETPEYVQRYQAELDEILDGLSERERIYATFSDRAAADKLGIKLSSVKRARYRMYDKLRDKHQDLVAA